MKKSLYHFTPRKAKHRAKLEFSQPKLEKIVPLEVSSSTHCFVTPLQVAQQMVSWLELERKNSILEPSAGTGNLIKALIDENVCISQIKAIELNHSLSDVLENRFPKLEVQRSCFLEYSISDSNRYDRIIMNPPYQHNKAKLHIEAAKKLLAPNGFIIACVPSNFSEGELLDNLPSGTFSNTQISTKLIRIN